MPNFFAPTQIQQVPNLEPQGFQFIRQMLMQRALMQALNPYGMSPEGMGGMNGPLFNNQGPSSATMSMFGYGNMGQMPGGGPPPQGPGGGMPQGPPAPPQPLPSRGPRTLPARYDARKGGHGAGKPRAPKPGAAPKRQAYSNVGSGAFWQQPPPPQGGLPPSPVGGDSRGSIPPPPNLFGNFQGVFGGMPNIVNRPGISSPPAPGSMGAPGTGVPGRAASVMTPPSRPQMQTLPMTPDRPMPRPPSMFGPISRQPGVAPQYDALPAGQIPSAGYDAGASPDMIAFLMQLMRLAQTQRLNPGPSGPVGGLPPQMAARNRFLNLTRGANPIRAGFGNVPGYGRDTTPGGQAAQNMLWQNYWNSSGGRTGASNEPGAGSGYGFGGFVRGGMPVGDVRGMAGSPAFDLRGSGLNDLQMLTGGRPGSSSLDAFLSPIYAAEGQRGNPDERGLFGLPQNRDPLFGNAPRYGQGSGDAWREFFSRGSSLTNMDRSFSGENLGGGGDAGQFMWLV